MVNRLGEKAHRDICRLKKWLKNHQSNLMISKSSKGRNIAAPVVMSRGNYTFNDGDEKNRESSVKNATGTNTGTLNFPISRRLSLH